MISKETVYNKDASNKKIKVEREFNATVKKVWEAWTEPELLDQWWAPKPWKAVTISQEFKEGGRWLYYMQGPEGERHYSKVDYERIVNEKSFSGKDGFCDEKGNDLQDMPEMHWDCQFNSISGGTKVTVDITFASTDDLEKIVQMGFKEGFAAAHTNLDEILEK